MRWLCLCLLGAPAWSQRWPELHLETQPIRSARNLEAVVKASGRTWEGSSEIWLLELGDGTRAVFRSEDEPWGSQAEVAGYRLTRWLGLELVPPTVPRTLQKVEWPRPWPFPGATRTGSLQLYLDTGRGQLDPLTRADIEVVSFVMGRYDNHDGNLLFDRQGRACMVDFENSLEIQQTRYGEIAYVRRGAQRDSLPSSTAHFPYDHPRLSAAGSIGLCR